MIGMAEQLLVRPTSRLLTRRELAKFKGKQTWEGNGEGSVGCSSELGSRAERNSVWRCAGVAIAASTDREAPGEARRDR